MTREEALSKVKGYLTDLLPSEEYDEVEEIIKALEQEPCEDLVSRLTAKEALNRIGESISDCINAIPPVTPTRKKGKWIPCSERLPKADEYNGDVAKYYLVQNEYGDMLVAKYTHSEYWEQIFQFQPIGDEIVAWMPLPEPYKEESEDKK